jgi:hypothetical protein
LVQRLHLGKSAVGVGVTGRGDERWANTHRLMLRFSEPTHSFETYKN